MVLEASSFDAWRVGETLAPGGRTILAGLGCWDSRALGALECYGTARGVGQRPTYDNEFLFSLHGSAWHLDRRAFDAALLECARRRRRRGDAAARLAHSWSGRDRRARARRGTPGRSRSRAPAPPKRSVRAA